MATIRKRNSRYHVQVRKKGYPSTTKTFNSLTGARKWAAGIETDMERQLYVVIPDNTTLGQLLDRYDTEVLPTHKGQQAERYRLRTLSKYFGNIRLANLIPKEVAKYRDLRLKEVSPASLKRELKILSRVLTLASKDWGIAVPQNPVTMITLPKSDKARTRRLELGEEAKLRHGSNPQLNQIIVLAIETAMRRGEMLGIKKSHIDFRNRTLLIPDTKTDRPRSIPLSTRAIKVLREQTRTYQGYTGGVVSLHETPLFSYRPRGLTGAFLKLCRRLGIEDLHFHDLRHEATSRFFEKGLNPVEVATITGHKDPRMLMRYTHLRAEDLVGRLG
jgi:integrase